MVSISRTPHNRLDPSTFSNSVHPARRIGTTEDLGSTPIISQESGLARKWRHG
jgi:hypothetical protein